jgi:hypothetical protein
VERRLPVDGEGVAKQAVEIDWRSAPRRRWSKSVHAARTPVEHLDQGPAQQGRSQVQSRAPGEAKPWQSIQVTRRITITPTALHERRAKCWHFPVSVLRYFNRNKLYGSGQTGVSSQFHWTAAVCTIESTNIGWARHKVLPSGHERP